MLVRFPLHHITQFSSVQFSCSVMSYSLWPHELQHDKPPCPSPTPGVYSNSCPLSQWCHPTISSSVIPFSCSQSFPASGSFPMSQLFTSGGQSIGVSSSTSALPMNIQDWFPLGWTGCIYHITGAQWKGLFAISENILGFIVSFLLLFFFLFVSSSWPFGFVTGLIFARASLLAQLVKNLHKMLENWVQSLGWEDPLEKGKATHSSMLAWRIPWTVYPMRSQRIRQDWMTLTQLISTHTVWNWWQVGFSGDFSPADSPSRYMLFLALTPETQPWH